jgi:uncharacterized protein with GYD domain
VSTYIVLMNQIDPPAVGGGAAGPTHEQQRQTIADAFAKAGGTLRELTWTLGRYDMVAQVDVDTDALNQQRSAAGDRPVTAQEVVAGFAYWLGANVRVRTETLAGLDENSMSAALSVAERCGG